MIRKENIILSLITRIVDVRSFFFIKRRRLVSIVREEKNDKNLTTRRNFF